ncbi:hypothetical protein RI367_005745 [Sorochytrium milnesiophthora]
MSASTQQQQQQQQQQPASTPAKRVPLALASFPRSVASALQKLMAHDSTKHSNSPADDVDYSKQAKRTHKRRPASVHLPLSPFPPSPLSSPSSSPTSAEMMAELVSVPVSTPPSAATATTQPQFVQPPQRTTSIRRRSSIDSSLYAPSAHMTTQQQLQQLQQLKLLQQQQQRQRMLQQKQPQPHQLPSPPATPSPRDEKPTCIAIPAAVAPVDILPPSPCSSTYSFKGPETASEVAAAAATAPAASSPKPHASTLSRYTSALQSRRASRACSIASIDSCADTELDISPPASPGASPKAKHVRFSYSVTYHDAHAPDDYDRSGLPSIGNGQVRLTQRDLHNIRYELNMFKLLDMKVHPTANVNTQFCHPITAPENNPEGITGAQLEGMVRQYLALPALLSTRR